MQGEEEAWFTATPKGETRYTEDGEPYLTDGLAFSITQLDDVGESYNEYVGYRWEDGSFRLVGYKDWDEFYGEVDVGEGVLHFKNSMEEWDFGKAYGAVQRDLRYVNFDALPKTIDAAKAELSSAPAFRSYKLHAQEVKFTGGQKYPVYTGPGETYARSGNGKGSVSTNDWIQVLGEYNGWIMIQYDISASQYRIGWIEKKALPKGAEVEALDFAALERPYNTFAVYACELTDDPLNSKKAIAQIPEGTEMTELMYAAFEGWSYVFVTVNGQTMCGFVPSDAPVHG